MIKKVTQSNQSFKQHKMHLKETYDNTEERHSLVYLPFTQQAKKKCFGPVTPPGPSVRSCVCACDDYHSTR